MPLIDSVCIVQAPLRWSIFLTATIILSVSANNLFSALDSVAACKADQSLQRAPDIPPAACSCFDAHMSQSHLSLLNMLTV